MSFVVLIYCANFSPKLGEQTFVIYSTSLLITAWIKFFVESLRFVNKFGETSLIIISGFVSLLVIKGRFKKKFVKIICFISLRMINFDLNYLIFL